MLCAKFGWNWPGDSGEEGFGIPSVYFRYFLLLSPLGKVYSPLFEKKTLVAINQGCYVPSLVEWPCGSREKDENVES